VNLSGMKLNIYVIYNKNNLPKSVGDPPRSCKCQKRNVNTRPTPQPIHLKKQNYFFFIFD